MVLIISVCFVCSSFMFWNFLCFITHSFNGLGIKAGVNIFTTSTPHHPPSLWENSGSRILGLKVLWTCLKTHVRPFFAKLRHDLAWIGVKWLQVKQLMDFYFLQKLHAWKMCSSWLVQKCLFGFFQSWVVN